MTAYRHAEAYPEPAQVACPFVPDIDGYVCGCTNPQPDPASPCGHQWSYHGTLAPCGKTREQHGPYPDAHAPTRCLNCGHALVAA